MHRAAAIAALALLARPASAETLEGWPCAGCITVVPSRAAGRPAPLLVALHGDGGGVKPLVRAWQAACEDAGVILLAPRCPREAGCAAGSFWQWYADARHDPAWLDAQIDAAAARFAVDPARVYATGYSGGATYLGWYVPAHPARFAAVAHVAGGARYGGACPSCKVPVLFTLGATDPMITPYTAPLRRWYEACGGHEIVWETLPGVTHESILGALAAGKARSILAWLLARPASCTDRDAGVSPVPPVVDAGPAADAGPGAGARAEDPSAIADPPPMPADPPPPPTRLPSSAAGCACGRGQAAGAFLGPVIGAGIWIGRRRRRGR
jgi:predicted esterase